MAIIGGWAILLQPVEKEIHLSNATHAHPHRWVIVVHRAGGWNLTLWYTVYAGAGDGHGHILWDSLNVAVRATNRRSRPRLHGRIIKLSKHIHDNADQGQV